MTENEVLIKTPEEAIETIKSNMPTSGYQMLRESLEMAITALKEVYQTYFFQKDKDPRTLGETIRFLKGIGAIPENDGKDDSSKPILSRVPPEINWAIERVREYGCRKYPEDSWRDVETQRYWEAVLRHTLAAWKDYGAVDPESGLPHIWHIACNLAFIIAQEGVDNGLDREDSGRD